MEKFVLKVGELAKKTGVSVRTLHYYEQLGILTASQRSSKGYRLYSENDIVKLQQIRSLQSLGFSLEKIRQSLRDPKFSLKNILPLQIEQLKDRISIQTALMRKLEYLDKRLVKNKSISVQEFIKAMETMSMTDSHFTDEQMNKIQAQGKKLGQDHISAVEEEWPELIKKVKVEMEKGTDPSNEKVQTLAKRWKELVNEFTGGDKGIAESLGKMYQEQGSKLKQQHGDSVPDKAVFEYIQKAWNAKQ